MISNQELDFYQPSSGLLSARPQRCTRMAVANLRAKILDFRGFDASRTLILRGGILMSMGNCEFPGNHESMNLSRDSLSREIRRTAVFLLKNPEISIESLKES